MLGIRLLFLLPSGKYMFTQEERFFHNVKIVELGLDQKQLQIVDDSSCSEFEGSEFA